MKKKRFQGKSTRRRGQAARHLSKQGRELLQSGDLDSWEEEAPEPPTTSRRPESSARADSQPEAGPQPEADSTDTVAQDGSAALFHGQIASLASGLAWVRPDEAFFSTGSTQEAKPETKHREAKEGCEGPIEDQEVSTQLEEDGTLLCVLPTSIARDQRSRITVGDRILFGAHGNDFRIVSILPRQTSLSRPDPLNPRLQRLIAANVDAVVQVASARQPALRPALIDRYLIAIQQGGATPILCVNKIDLVPASERQEVLATLAAYRGLELPLILTSVETGEGLEQLRPLLEGKTVAFVGHSGVGKSSLVNALDPDISAEVGKVSVAYDKGRHTTTRSSLYDLQDGIRVIDTPGIRELGLLDIDRAALPHYFPDFTEYAAGCRFQNCTHSHEPDCAVRQAVDEGEIPAARFATYQRILESLA